MARVTYMFSQDYISLSPSERDNGAALAELPALPDGYSYEPYWESQFNYLKISDNILYLDQNWHYEISTSYFTELSFSSSGQWSTYYRYMSADGDGIEYIPVKIIDQSGIEQSWFYVVVEFAPVDIDSLTITPISFEEGVYGAVVAQIDNVPNDFEVYIGSRYLEIDEDLIKLKDEYRYLNERVATYDGVGWSLDSLQNSSQKDYFANIFLTRDSEEFAEARVEISWNSFDDIFLSDNVTALHREGIDDNIFLSSITSAFKWHQHSITYAFAPSGMDLSSISPSREYDLTIEYSGEEKDTFRSAADLISSYANISFVEIDYGGTADKLIAKVPEIATPNNPHIEYAGGFSGGPYSSTYVMSQDAALDLDTHVHELGHTLGLEHPWEETTSKTGKLPGIDEDAFDPGDYGHHSPYWTVMSYGNAVPDTLIGVEMPAPALGVVDVAALQRVYGANMTTNLGNSEYRPSDSFQVLWDAGGIDSISFGVIEHSSFIDLRPADLSFDEDGPGGLSFTRHDGKLSNILQIVPDAWIENAVGGTGNDVIIGNELNNVLHGGAGQDRLDGGDGGDTLNGGLGDDTLTGGEGEDHFMFSFGAGHDVITDFDGTADRLQISDRDGSWQTIQKLQWTQNADSSIVFWAPDADSSITVYGTRVHLSFGNTISGTMQADWLLGSEEGDLLSGKEGNDTIVGSGGNDYIDGGGGVDLVEYSGNQLAYTLVIEAQALNVTDRRADGNGADVLQDIEILNFERGPYASFDLQVFAGTANLTPASFKSFIELYIAYFNRAPDAVGLNFWGTAFSKGTSLDEMARLFALQEEALSAYPSGTPNVDFATTVYGNVLGRVPDPAGLDFWVGGLDSGAVSRDQFILEVLRGVRDGSDDREYLDRKVDIGAYFAVHKGMSNTENASAAMALFDGSEESVTAAVNAIDAFYVTALSPDTGEFILQILGVLPDTFST